jgi:hypothetical protein
MFDIARQWGLASTIEEAISTLGPDRTRSALSKRKKQLLAVACFRQVVEWVDPRATPVCERVLAEAESFAEGRTPVKKRQAAREKFRDDFVAAVEDQMTEGSVYALDAGQDVVAHMPHAWISAVGLSLWAICGLRQDAGELAGRDAAASVQVKLMHDIFGNPFRPVSFDPAWRTEAAVGIAHAAYDSREFGNLPVLADALQDAGCEHPDILNHLRGPGPHVRGCWVVDLVLGKA